MELHDGDRDYLRAAAGRDLLRVPPSHDRRAYAERGQGLTSRQKADDRAPDRRLYATTHRLCGAAERTWACNADASECSMKRLVSPALSVILRPIPASALGGGHG